MTAFHLSVHNVMVCVLIQPTTHVRYKSHTSTADVRDKLHHTEVNKFGGPDGVRSDASVVWYSFLLRHRCHQK